MKLTSIFVVIALFFGAITASFAQVGINIDGSAPHNSAMLDVKSTNKGLLIPRLTTGQRNALNATATAGLMVYDTDLNRFFYHNGSGWQEGATGNYWLGDGTNVYLNDINDNVGIGTASPARKFEVNGASRATRLSTSTSGPFLEFTGSSTTDWSIGQWSDIFWFSTSTNNFTTTADQFMFTTYTFRTFNDNEKSLGEISARWSNTYSVDGNFSGLFTGNNGYFSGNVGIGAASPARKLEVNSGGNYKTARITSTNSGSMMEFNANFTPDWAIGTWTGTLRILSSNDDLATLTDEFMFNQSAFRPYTNNTKTLGEASGRWSNAYSVDGNFSGLLTGNDGYFTGDVGIGTSTPARQFEISGGWKSARITTTSSGPFIEFVGSSTTDWTIGLWGNSFYLTSTDNTFASWTDEYLFSTSVFKSIAGSKTLGDASNRWSNIYAADGNYSGNIAGNTATFTGQVAVGTTNLLGALHVHDGVNQKASLYISPITTGSEDSSMVFLAEDHDGTYGMFWLYDGGGNHMELWGKSGTTTYGPHLTVQRDNGNMSIGDTFATGYKLSVEGKIICTELRVNQVIDWPDYVFAEDYQLMPLDHLRDFINTNGHLPNIPAASSIEASGMDVGEMQRLMMEKIEELSLYILQQQEEIEALKERIENDQE